MAWYHRFLNIFKSGQNTPVSTIATNFAPQTPQKEIAAPPPNGGRSSEFMPVGNISGSLKGLKNYELKPDFALEWIKVLRGLSIYDRHVGNAISRFVALANTDISYEFPDNISKSKAYKMRQLISQFEHDYNNGTGFRDFIKNGFETLVYSGGLPCEAVLEGKPYPNKIKHIAILNPEFIRYIYDDTMQGVIPVQQVPYAGSEKKLRGVNYIELNPMTFTHTAIKRLEENPYPVPIFLNAMEDLHTNKEMIKSFNIVMKNIGLMGFLNVLIKQPPKKNGETDQQHYNRCLDVLNQTAREIETSRASGIIVGFEGHHKFDFAANNSNFDGVDKAFQVINKLLFNGLKIDGAFMGENNSTTETYSTVLLKILTSFTADMQYAMAATWQKFVLLHLNLNGFYPDYIKVVMKPSAVGDEYKEAQTEEIQIRNVLAKFQAGIIDLQQAANELGYDKPATEQPLGNVGLKKKAKSVDFTFNCQPPQDYCDCGSHTLSYEDADLGDSYLTKKANAYYNKLSGNYDSAVRVIKKELKAAIQERLKVVDKISQTELVSLAITTIALNWDKEFSQNITEDVSDTIEAVYKKYRGDKSIFPKPKQNSKSFGDIPEPINTPLDIRLIEWLKNSDNFYLGKFVTDPETIRRFREWIIDWYVLNDGDIGNSQTLNEFTNQFGETLGLEKWQIRRIIDTTMVNIRGYANVSYMNQAGVTTFRRSEVVDRLTCQHCAKIHNMEFSVASEMTKITSIVNDSPENVGKYAGFGVAIPFDEFDNLTPTDIQTRGIGANAMHPHCRGRVVAVVA